MSIITIQNIIDAESKKGTIIECSIELTQEIREMVVYHHEWAKELYREDDNLACVIFAGRSDIGVIVIHHLGDKYIGPICWKQLENFHIMDID